MDQFFSRALDIRPDDYFLLKNKGVSLARIGMYDKAFEVLDKSLIIKPDDQSLIILKAGFKVLTKQYEEGIEILNKILSTDPSDFKALFYKAVALSNLDQIDEALESYDKSLAISPNFCPALSNKSKTLFKKGNVIEALELIEEAKKLNPNSEIINSTYRYIAKFLETTSAADKDGKEHALGHIEQGIPELRAVIDKVRFEMGGRVDEFIALMKSTQKKRNEFLSTESLLKNDISFLLILRKWNSYTPIIPADNDERYVGGGYFIYNKGQGTVIDPGYNFIENFYNAGGRIIDIHNIILTHAHDDHTSDFEAILTLLYQYNKKNKINPGDDAYKRVKVYANTGSIIKFSGLINLRGAKYLDHVYTTNPGLKFSLHSDLELEIIEAYHDELITKDYATGVKLNFGEEENQKTIIITSDTGLFPIAKNKKNGENVADIKGPEVWEGYAVNKTVNLLIAHIGSIRQDEFEASIDSEYDEIFYPNHLGIIGTTRVITALRPNIAIVSEFGEELSSFQRDLVEIIERSVKGFFEGIAGPVPRVLPGDLPFIYDIDNELIYCVMLQKMVNINDIRVSLPDPNAKKRFYYYDKSIDRVDEIGAKVEEFEKQRSERKGLFYFKDN